MLLLHPRRPRGGQWGREKRRDKSFQVQAEKPLGTDSHRTISKRSRSSSECCFLIRHKKCFVLLCPIGVQHLPSSFREFVRDGYYSCPVRSPSFSNQKRRNYTLGSRGFFCLIDTVPTEAALTQKKKRRGVIFFSSALCASLTQLRREPSVSIRKKYPLEPRVKELPMSRKTFRMLSAGANLR